MRVLISSLKNNLTMISELIPIMDLLINNGIDCEYIMENNNPAVIEKIQNPKIQLTVLNNDFKSNKTNNSKKRYTAIIKNLYLLATTYKKQRELIYKTELLFNKKVDLLIVAGDRHLGVELALIYHARMRNIPIIIPQLAINDKGFMVKLRSNNNLYGMNKIFAKLYPKNVFKNCHFYSWGNALALKLLGILPKDPWNIGNSFATKYLATFNIYKDLAIKDGMNPDKIEVAGQIAFDKLLENYNSKETIKRNLLKKYFNMDKNSRVIVFSLPQFYEHYLMSREKSIDEIKYLLQELEQLSIPVLISLHPKMKYKDYEFIEQNFKMIKVVRDERLSEIICISEFFISCFASTLPWASLVNSKPIFLDYYNLGLDVEIFPDCIKFLRKESFQQDIKSLLINNINNKECDINKYYFDTKIKCKEKILSIIQGI